VDVVEAAEEADAADELEAVAEADAVEEVEGAEAVVGCALSSAERGGGVEGARGAFE
jgi:hypothetical protein